MRRQGALFRGNTEIPFVNNPEKLGLYQELGTMSLFLPFLKRRVLKDFFFNFRAIPF